MPNKSNSNQTGETRNLLKFMGERSRPSIPSSLQDRKPIIGTGEIPSDLLRLARTREYYIQAAKADHEPKITLERMGDGLDNIWCLQVHETTGDFLPGRTAIREKPEKIINEVDPQIGFTSYRPDWASSMFAPRISADRYSRPMRRFNGRSAEPLYVFGTDDRKVYRDSSWPWGLVGKIYNSDGMQGTGALIGKRIIATASHMIPWYSLAQGSWWMRFIPACYKGFSLFGVGVESYVSDCIGYDTSGYLAGYPVTGYDFAVCRLYNPLGDSLGYFGYNDYIEDWNDHPYWTLLGYPIDLDAGLNPSFQTLISVTDTDSDAKRGLEIESNADVTQGSSGGPFFGWWNGDPRLIGVVSGEELELSFNFSSPIDKVNVVAGGSGFTNLMAWGRTNWAV